MAKYVGEGVKIKAAGGISSLEDAKTFIALELHAWVLAVSSRLLRMKLQNR